MAAPKGYLTTYPGAYLSEKDFAILMDGLVAPNYSALISGCNTTVNGSTVTITGGNAIIRGRVVEITGGSLECPFSSSGTVKKYLVAKMKIYTSDSDDGTVTFEISDYIYSPYIYDQATDPQYGHGVNYYGGVAYLPIAELTVTTTAITAKRTAVLDLDKYIKSIGTNSVAEANTYTDGKITQVSSDITRLDDDLSEAVGDIDKDVQNLSSSVTAMNTRVNAVEDTVESLNVDYLNEIFKATTGQSGTKTAAGNPATLVNNTYDRATSLIIDFPVVRNASDFMPGPNNVVTFVPVTQSKVTIKHGNDSHTDTYSYATTSSGETISNVYGGSYNATGTLTAYKYYADYNGENISENWMSTRCFKIKDMPATFSNGVCVAVQFNHSLAGRITGSLGKATIRINGIEGPIYDDSTSQPIDTDITQLMKSGTVWLFRYGTKSSNNGRWYVIRQINSEPGGISSIYISLWDSGYYYALTTNVSSYYDTDAQSTTLIITTEKKIQTQPNAGDGVLDLGASVTYTLPTSQRFYPSLYQGTNTATVDKGTIRQIGYGTDYTGTFVLKAIIDSGGNITYEWVKES